MRIMLNCQIYSPLHMYGHFIVLGLNTVKNLNEIYISISNCHGNRLKMGGITYHKQHKLLIKEDIQEMTQSRSIYINY